FFFDNMDLQFQINKQEDGRTKDIKLNLVKYIPPSVDSNLFSSNWEDDTKPLSKEDTIFTKQELTAHEFSRIKTLKTAVVKGWKSPREELDHRYTSGPFSEPALYSYDLRTYDGRDRTIFNYINSLTTRLRYNMITNRIEDVQGHPVHFFIDEQP